MSIRKSVISETGNVHNA